LKVPKSSEGLELRAEENFWPAELLISMEDEGREARFLNWRPDA
jgi:hypothetical protein